MKRSLARLGILGLMALIPADSSAFSQGGKPESPWLTDYAQACRLARTSGKPLLVVFRCEY